MIKFSLRDLLVQEALIARGYKLGLADGYYGPKTATAFQKYLEDFHGKIIIAQTWPADKEEALNAFFGKPDMDKGIAPNIVRVELPYNMFLAWDKSVEIDMISCNKEVADSLVRILTRIRDELGMEFIKEHGLHLFGGCVNVRNMRGSNNPSRHSWGVAIDLNPEENGLHTPWIDGRQGEKGFATMPTKVVEIFEAAGWKSGARAWSSDAMHFQCTQ